MAQEREDILNTGGSQLTGEGWLIARLLKATLSCQYAFISAPSHRVMFTFQTDSQLEYGDFMTDGFVH